MFVASIVLSQWLILQGGRILGKLFCLDELCQTPGSRMAVSPPATFVLTGPPTLFSRAGLEDNFLILRTTLWGGSLLLDNCRQWLDCTRNTGLLQKQKSGVQPALLL